MCGAPMQGPPICGPRSFPVKGRLFYTSGPYKITEEIHYAFDH